MSNTVEIKNILDKIGSDFDKTRQTNGRVCRKDTEQMIMEHIGNSSLFQLDNKPDLLNKFCLLSKQFKTKGSFIIGLSDMLHDQAIVAQTTLSGVDRLINEYMSEFDHLSRINRIVKRTDINRLIVHLIRSSSDITNDLKTDYDTEVV